MSDLYANPKYYEIAFSFRDIAKEVDVFQKCITQHSKIPVKSVLELGCGNSPHLLELLKRGYRYTGIDLSQEMLEFSKSKVSEEMLGKTTFLQANMNDFRSDDKVDFAFILLGSIYAKTTADLLSHFKCVSETLNTGGLYFLEYCVNFEPLSDTKDSWTMEKDNIVVSAQYSGKIINQVEQLYEENIVLNVSEKGQDRIISLKETKRAVYPQEFLCIINNIKSLEFVGWWNDWDLGQELGKAAKINRPIIILRKV